MRWRAGITAGKKVGRIVVGRAGGGMSVGKKVAGRMGTRVGTTARGVGSEDCWEKGQAGRKVWRIAGITIPSFGNAGTTLQ